MVVNHIRHDPLQVSCTHFHHPNNSHYTLFTVGTLLVRTLTYKILYEHIFISHIYWGLLYFELF